VKTREQLRNPVRRVVVMDNGNQLACLKLGKTPAMRSLTREPRKSCLEALVKLKSASVHAASVEIPCSPALVGHWIRMDFG